ncbi:hypothetical protein R3P38DRAFT_2499538 [Favolaschia claudopus]|uniref:Uncharacterized protein n=1 Tax=Favolaschia claudopus TaxID=2862362 RepID=A0AAW0DWU5_9AGAR
MGIRYATPDHLRLRSPMPQLDIGNLDPGEDVIVQNVFGAADPDEFVPKDHSPQQVPWMASATHPVLLFSLPANAISQESMKMESTTTVVSTALLSVSSSQASPSATASSSSPTASSFSLTASSSSLTASSSSSSIASVSPTSLQFVSSVSVSVSSTSASTSSAPTLTSSTGLPLSSPSASSSITAAISDHGAVFWSAMTLGLFIAIACVAAVVACLIRSYTRRRDAAAIDTMAWDPAVVARSTTTKHLTMPASLSLIGDRDVGEPKRSLGYPRTPPPSDGPLHTPNPYVETAYYSTHQIPRLSDSAAYPLPPLPSQTVPLPVLRSNDGPYPTARPLPAHLADRDPHRIHQPDHTIPRLWRSATGSRSSGSVRSHIPSATTGTLCIVNGSASQASSSASSVHGREEEEEEEEEECCDGHTPDVGRATGTPRVGDSERRPRLMSLNGGRAIDVPWRRESLAVRRGGDRTPGWVRLPAEGEMTPGWTQTLRASVLNAIYAVTGVGGSGSTQAEMREAKSGNDGFTRAPSMGRARERREEGWRRFAREEMQMEREVHRQGSVAFSHSTSEHLADMERHSHLESPGVTMQPSAAAVAGAEQSPAQLSRPRPAALVSRASSVYSTASAMSGTRI